MTDLIFHALNFYQAMKADFRSFKKSPLITAPGPTHCGDVFELHRTANHVETQVRLYRRTKRIEALEEENLRHGHRELSWYIDDNDYWVFKGRFTPEQGALLLKAQANEKIPDCATLI